MICFGVVFCFFVLAHMLLRFVQLCMSSSSFPLSVLLVSAHCPMLFVSVGFVICPSLSAHHFRMYVFGIVSILVYRCPVCSNLFISIPRMWGVDVEY